MAPNTTAFLIVKHSQRSEAGETNVVERVEFDTRVRTKDTDKATFILDLVTGEVVINRLVSLDPDLLTLHYQNRYMEEILGFLGQHGIEPPQEAGAAAVAE